MGHVRIYHGLSAQQFWPLYKSLLPESYYMYWSHLFHAKQISSKNLYLFCVWVWKMQPVDASRNL